MTARVSSAPHSRPPARPGARIERSGHDAVYGRRSGPVVGPLGLPIQPGVGCVGRWTNERRCTTRPRNEPGHPHLRIRTPRRRMAYGLVDGGVGRRPAGTRGTYESAARGWSRERSSSPRAPDAPAQVSVSWEQSLSRNRTLWKLLVREELVGGGRGLLAQVRLRPCSLGRGLTRPSSSSPNRWRLDRSPRSASTETPGSTATRPLDGSASR